MAYDKVIDSAQLDSALTATADAIRGKTGEASPIAWDAVSGFAAAVAGISTGGGTLPAVQPKEVNFYDYDGTLVHAYTVAEAQALTELPPGPSHDGLVFQGWNWSLESVNTLTRAMNVGAVYTTDDGTTRIHITLQEGRTSPMLGMGVNGTVTVDWGDDTESDVLEGTNVNTVQWTPTHHYAAPGDYIIRLTVNGSAQFMGANSTNGYAYVLRYASGGDARNRAYLNSVKKVEIGNGIASLAAFSFMQCGALKFVTIPKSVSNIWNSVFSNCAALKFIIFPESVTNIRSTICQYCGSLENVILSDAEIIIGSSGFQNCDSLEQFTITDRATSIGGGVLQGCRSLESFVVPEGIESIDIGMFHTCQDLSSVVIPGSVVSIGVNAFHTCFSLARVIIPPRVASIGASAFSGCSGVAYYDFAACASVPTLGDANVFTGISDDCEIRVPATLYDEWIAATNWTTYADYIVAV